VLVLVARHGRGKTSGLELDANSAHLLELRDGNVIKLVHHSERNRALAGLGLEV
jgi:ketosteroid isomerase-like protein